MVIVQVAGRGRNENTMAQKANSLAHAKWMCRCHIVSCPKHGRKAICSRCPEGLGMIPSQPCQWKGVEMMEGHLMPDHVHMLAGIPPRIGVPGFMGCLKGKSALLMSGKACNLKYKFGNREFWAEGCYVSAAGMNEATIAKYIREQEAADIALGKLGVKEHEDPFSRK
jgi:putative transposase